ncbi:anthranilate synthase component II [Thermodesulforhabdus norvegica]|uniref:anthranilate synthase component II n=1 Tax=Thermodesulforhabdus norvegica TaxID=39841 RepID=UPI001FE00076|nr:aminodeoxychorismate/anthranilate synthase component II [Thermodesulforhabdus norvegica]
MKRFVMIDNYDSFTYNLVQLLGSCGADVIVFRHDETTVKDIDAIKPDAICISPGPRDPAHAGISAEVVRTFAGKLPILGVCLGMQVINEVYGGKTVHAPLPVHGKTSMIKHTGRDIFSGIPSPFKAARYHSLCIKRCSDELVEMAWSDDGVVMAVKHKDLPVFGVQFHPESFMTEFGKEIILNFINLELFR